ncbi:MAG: tRNA pseudouridine38-40 synthase [Nocardioidaceae bacterium]|nr:tRNA pseudouridine38-40 synthase [Nocardioidaceae bacterium]
MRLRLDLSYDGSGFHGWAVQPGLRTVQGELEGALARVLRLEAVPVTCAGRTDTGVHARGQVVHLDVDEETLTAAAGRSPGPPVKSLLRRLNGVLDPDVRVRAAVQAPAGFDARFSASWRRYVYRIADSPVTLDPLMRNHVVWWRRPLDERLMNDAAPALLGEHDFAAYCRPRPGATTVRELLELRWQRSGGGILEATVRADAFCHSMVRALVGGLVSVGERRRPPAWPAEVLTAGKRDPGVQVMAAAGLTLEEVAYPSDEELAARAEKTRVVRVRG